MTEVLSFNLYLGRFTIVLKKKNKCKHMLYKLLHVCILYIKYMYLLFLRIHVVNNNQQRTWLYFYE